MVVNKLLADLVSRKITQQKFYIDFDKVRTVKGAFISKAKAENPQSIPLQIFKDELTDRDPDNPFLPLYNQQHRYNILTGGRGSAKTTNALTYALFYTYQKDIGVLVTRYTAASMGVSTIPEVTAILLRLHEEGLVDFNDFHITQNKVVNRTTGSLIYFYGLKSASKKETARLKSLSTNFNVWLIEEAEELTDKKLFDDTDNSIRTVGKYNQIILIMNPTNQHHFVYKDFIQFTHKLVKFEGFDVPISIRPDTLHIHTTFKYAEQNGWLDETWLFKKEKAKADLGRNIGEFNLGFSGSTVERLAEITKLKLTSAYYYIYIGGWAIRSELCIYHNWIRGEFDLSLPHYYGLDFGFYPDPLGCIKVAIDEKRKRIYLQEVAYQTRVVEVPDYLKAKGVELGAIVVADTNEKNTFVRLIRVGFRMIKARKAAGSVVAGIKDLLTYTIVVCGDSPNLEFELNNYEWLDDKADTPQDKNNHLLDPARYVKSYVTKG